MKNSLIDKNRYVLESKNKKKNSDTAECNIL